MKYTKIGRLADFKLANPLEPGKSGRRLARAVYSFAHFAEVWRTPKGAHLFAIGGNLYGLRLNRSGRIAGIIPLKWGELPKDFKAGTRAG